MFSCVRIGCKTWRRRARKRWKQLLSRVCVFQYSKAMLRWVSRVRIYVMGSFARVPCQEKQTLQVRRSVIRERRHKVRGDSGDDFVASWHLHLTPRTSQPSGARRDRDGVARLPAEAVRSQADAAGV